jgi:hypothetical protein
MLLRLLFYNFFIYFRLFFGLLPSHFSQMQLLTVSFATVFLKLLFQSFNFGLHRVLVLHCSSQLHFSLLQCVLQESATFLFLTELLLVLTFQPFQLGVVGLPPCNHCRVGRYPVLILKLLGINVGFSQHTQALRVKCKPVFAILGLQCIACLIYIRTSISAVSDELLVG